MKVMFTRHGKDNDKYRGGWSSFDLLPEGIEQAKKLSAYLNDNQYEYRIATIISSDLTRAVTTAEIIAEELGLTVIKEKKLREMNNGDLAGMLNEIALVKYPGLFFNTLEINEPYPNGESPMDFFCRIKAWFENFVFEYSNQSGNILVVTHSGVIDIVYHLIKNIEWSNMAKHFKVSNCSIHILDTDTMKI